MINKNIDYLIKNDDKYLLWEYKKLKKLKI